MPENVSQIVKLKGAMPPNSRLNGVHNLAAGLVRDSEQELWAVVRLTVDKVEDKHIREEGEAWHQRTPVLQVAEIEALAGHRAEEAERLMMAARERRTGGYQGDLFSAAGRAAGGDDE